MVAGSGFKLLPSKRNEARHSSRNQISTALHQMAALLELNDANVFRVRSYQNGSRLIGSLSEDIGELVASKGIYDLKGVGKGLGNAISRAVQEGEWPEDWHEIHDKTPAGLIEMLGIPGVGPKRVMIELETTVELFSRSTDDGQVLLSGELERILNKNLVDGSILDAHIAQNEEQRLIMWERREAAAEISLLKKPLINNDIAVPLEKISEFLTIMEKKLPELDPEADVLIVSHLGDGNVHYTVWPSLDDEKHKDKIMEAIENVVLLLGGSFSAEHGIGISKLSSMERRKDSVALKVMRQIKDAIDPKGIMNPGKVLPREYDS